MSPFASISGRFVRNPLGIIALFIVLVYAMAGFVATSDSLYDVHRTILVVFLVAFPVLVLFAFLYLVISHSEKLYAPSDFAHGSNFFSGTRQRQL